MVYGKVWNSPRETVTECALRDELMRQNVIVLTQEEVPFPPGSRMKRTWIDILARGIVEGESRRTIAKALPVYVDGVTHSTAHREKQDIFINQTLPKMYFLDPLRIPDRQLRGHKPVQGWALKIKAMVQAQLEKEEAMRGVGAVD